MFKKIRHNRAKYNQRKIIKEPFSFALLRKDEQILSTLDSMYQLVPLSHRDLRGNKVSSFGTEVVKSVENNETVLWILHLYDIYMRCVLRIERFDCTQCAAIYLDSVSTRMTLSLAFSQFVFDLFLCADYPADRYNRNCMRVKARMQTTNKQRSPFDRCAVTLHLTCFHLPCSRGTTPSAHRYIAH